MNTMQKSGILSPDGLYRYELYGVARSLLDGGFGGIVSLRQLRGGIHLETR